MVTVSVIAVIIFLIQPGPISTQVSSSILGYTLIDHGDFKEFYGDTDDGYVVIQAENEKVWVTIKKGGDKYDYYAARLDVQLTLSDGSVINIIGDNHFISLTIANITHNINFDTMKGEIK